MQPLISKLLTMAASSLSGTVPYVVTFCYKAFTQTANKRTATCKVCGIRINDAGSTTSNFIRHLKTHKDRSVSFECEREIKRVSTGTANILIKVNSAVNYMKSS